MPSKINMPQQSDTMTEGTVVKWLKKEGDKVKAGEVIAEIETDKAVMEMESSEAGTLAAILAKDGQKVAVGAAIAILATGSEKVEDVKKSAGASTAAAPAAKAESAPAPQAAAASPAGSSAPGWTAPKAQRAPISKDEEPAGGQGFHPPTSDTTVAVAEQEAKAAAAAYAVHQTENGQGGRLFASPLARRIAADKGIDLRQVKGSGPGGRIVQLDVLNFKPAPAAPVEQKADGAKPQATPAPARVSRGTTDVQPLTKMRGAIATALQRSKQQIPHFYVTVDVDVEELFNMRVRLNKALEADGVKVSVNDFVTKASCVALMKHPAVNAHWTGDSITRFGDVHIGVAVAIPDGLIVPVIKNADQMGLKELQQRTGELAKKAKAQKLKGDEMKGATFTISNLGMFGVKEFSAIINPPEVAILAVAAAEKRAVVKNDQIVARWTMSLTLSCDHRAVDGATAAEFMRTLKGLLEEPGLMLV
ncbi:pyruvate dehydrogenase complex dihydrolipoamide acetyltransferase [Humisphaera borealis]|uniref:Acetyltransferase component of pyruvate dehydrogenase complex n=1 Tax=Humisphaera borealis TaxID=2807512 RepID=A0A7M2WTV9_9BACT|nr:pyruvate dehydrogenase complex dihydrolipoamide acetyltransferase [Humisphaera borealis]QOV88916.1 pyruvate dehydrogenase complex dihydrolipoamide acetyltransferase [Humisphaera borealis]